MARLRATGVSLPRVVEDNPDGVPHAGAEAAHAVAEVHAVVALRSLHWPVMDCEGHSITLPKWHDLSTALHARPLFGQNELATCEVLARLREQDRNLDRECEFAIEVLVEAVEVTRDILQQQRRWARLTGVVASLEERCVVVGIALRRFPSGRSIRWLRLRGADRAPFASHR